MRELELKKQARKRMRKRIKSHDDNRNVYYGRQGGEHDMTLIIVAR